MKDNNEFLFQMGLFRDAIEIIVQLMPDMQEKEMLRIAEFFPHWKPNFNYGNNQFIRYGYDLNGRAVLYKTTKSFVSNANQTPDITTSNYQKVIVK